MGRFWIEHELLAEAGRLLAAVKQGELSNNLVIAISGSWSEDDKYSAFFAGLADSQNCGHMRAFTTQGILVFVSPDVAALVDAGNDVIFLGDRRSLQVLIEPSAIYGKHSGDKVTSLLEVHWVVS